MNFQQILHNLFSFGNSSEAIAFSIIIIISFLIAALLSFFLFGGAFKKKMKQEQAQFKSEIDLSNEKLKQSEEKYNVQSSKLKRLEEEAAKYEVQLSETQDKNHEIQANFDRLNFGKEAAQRRADNAEKELGELKKLYQLSQQDNISIEDKINRLMEQKDEAVSKLEEFKNMMEELEKERFNASGNADEAIKKAAETKVLADKLQREAEELRTEILKLKSRVEEKEQITLDLLRVNSMQKQQLAELDLKIEILEAEKLEKQSVNTVAASTQKIENFFSGLSIPLEEEQYLETAQLEFNNPALEFENNAKELTAEVLTEIKTANPEEFFALKEQLARLLQKNNGQIDDLKQISSIDLSAEEKLNSLGIFTYEQMLQLNDIKQMRKICQIMGLNEATMHNEQWQAQARQLLTKQKINKLTKDINLNKLFKK